MKENATFNLAIVWRKGIFFWVLRFKSVKDMYRSGCLHWHNYQIAQAPPFGCQGSPPDTLSTQVQIKISPFEENSWITKSGRDVWWHVGRIYGWSN